MKMIGRTCPVGPGGRDCVCCGQAPGKARTQARRRNKRRERQTLGRTMPLHVDYDAIAKWLNERP